MPLKAPDMEKCTEKCKCGFGENKGVVYDPLDPCEGQAEANPDLFDPLKCDCDVQAVAGYIQWMATSADSTALLFGYRNNPILDDQGLNQWFDIMTPPRFQQTNANGRLYTHIPFVPNVIFSGTYSGGCDETFPLGPGSASECTIGCPQWPTRLDLEKMFTCATPGGSGCSIKFTPILLRYDPDTGEQVLFGDRCTSGTISVAYHNCVDYDPTCIDTSLPPGDPGRIQVPVGFKWGANIRWRYAKESLILDGTFDFLDDSHWNYIG